MFSLFIYELTRFPLPILFACSRFSPFSFGGILCFRVLAQSAYFWCRQKFSWGALHHRHFQTRSFSPTPSCFFEIFQLLFLSVFVRSTLRCIGNFTLCEPPSSAYFFSSVNQSVLLSENVPFLRKCSDILVINFWFILNFVS